MFTCGLPGKTIYPGEICPLKAQRRQDYQDSLSFQQKALNIFFGYPEPYSTICCNCSACDIWHSNQITRFQQSLTSGVISSLKTLGKEDGLRKPPML